jgi:hypothetical protein
LQVSQIKNKNITGEFIKRWTGSLLLLPVIVYYTINHGKFTFIDYINLLIHEGGHGIFKIFGKYIYTLGGSLMQVLIPSMFIVFYLIKQRRIGVQIFMIWLGENLFNISVYAADARTIALPLLGGHKVYHDWNYLLSEINMLDYDQTFGTIFFGTGIILFILSFFMPLFIKNSKTFVE